MSRAGRRGFSLLEVLTVVAIIALLAGVAVIAFRSVGDKAGVNSGRVTMENLRTMLAEAESSAVLKRQPSSLWFQNANVLTGAAGTSGRKADLWRAPDADAVPPTPMFSPGLLIETSRATYIQTDMVRNTGIALAMMRSVPVVGKSLDGLASRVNQTPQFWTVGTAYPVGARVLYDPASGSFRNLVYLALRDVPQNVAPTPGSSDSNWALSYGAVLDPFGNPILFVPATGFQLGKPHSPNKPYGVGDRVYLISGPTRTYYECITATTSAPPLLNTWRDVTATPIRSPDGKPFWASAGPDGDMDTPADNFYSFEN